jgi:aldose 1-epimerase
LKEIPLPLRLSFFMSSSLFRIVVLAFSLFVSLPPAFAADPDALPPGEGKSTLTPGQPEERPFGHTMHGEPVTLYTLTNKNGVSVSIMDYGATIVKILAPDRNGKLDDIVLGFDKFSPYIHLDAYFGATIGRYANRLAKGQFQLMKNTYQVPPHLKEFGNSLHGGVRGFDKQMWKMEPVDSDVPAVRFTRLSPDGEEGFPGNLFTSVTFSLNDDNQLRIAYEATSDKPTIVNLTNHSYFNLSGGGSILDDVATIHADSFTPVDDVRLPTGEIKKVAGTPWDFLNPTVIGSRFKDLGDTPIGYDHNFVLNKGFFSDWAVAAEVDDPKSGRTLIVSTDQPGLQFYTGNFLDGSLTGVGGKVYSQYSAFCLETQHFPDSPHHDNFPSTVLMPGDTYKTATVYTFGTK